MDAEMEERMCLDEGVKKNSRKKSQWKIPLAIIAVIAFLAIFIGVAKPPTPISAHHPDAILRVTPEKVFLDVPESVFEGNPSFHTNVEVDQ